MNVILGLNVVLNKNKMKTHTRRSVAYIVGSVISKNKRNSVYDYSTSQYYSFSGNFDQNQISVYDHTESCHVSGSLPSVYHYGNGKHISIQINEDRFTGYDYDESCHFSGSVNGNSVSIYDYGESSYFNYLI